MSQNHEEVEFDLPFAMTDAERMSPLWIRISTELEKKLAAARARNDNEHLSERETAALRGYIKSLKTILGLGDEMPPTE